jgi:glycosyltransferase involved in cell wall biosynthesis/ADP-heptose:LPS heptosyltransferase
MRLVVDLQGAQTESSFRGIGRYSLALAESLARQGSGHELILALNAMFPETIERIRAHFDGLVSQDNIRVWDAPGPVRAVEPSNALRRSVSERIREAFLADLHPDAVLITSLFEGLGDDAVTSVGASAYSMPTAAVLYDLIPLINPDVHFQTSVIHRDWYSSKIASLRRCKLMLAISESSRLEVIDALGVAGADVVNISGACDARFRELGLSADARGRSRRKAGIKRPFVMYSGGADERKNLARLVEAFAALPRALRARFQLALVGKMPGAQVAALRSHAASLGMTDELVVTGYVNDVDLVQLYNSCELFVFPSLHEGLGLPPLEAMACGAPVIAADATSLPEVIGFKEALFDPLSGASITSKMADALTDPEFRARLVAHGHQQCREFTWDATATRCWKALERFTGSASATSAGPELRATGVFRPERKRVLVQKLDHRGDFILALPAMSKLRARYPDASLEALVGSWNEEMARDCGLFDQVHVLNFFRSASAEAASLVEGELAGLVQRLGHFDMALDLRRQADTRFILTRIDAPLRVAYETFDAALDRHLHIKLQTFTDVPFEITPLNRTHITEQMLRLVDALPGAVSDFIKLPSFGGAESPRGIQVALFPVAGNDVKQWSERQFIELTKRLAAESMVDRVNVYFGAAREASTFDFGNEPKISTHVGLAFPMLVKSLSGNTVCVANNSFGAHIAGYVGCTVIGIYGGHETVDEWSPPFGNSFVMHTGQFCSPCHVATRGECPYEMACLTGVSVDAVFDDVLAACDGRLEATTPATSQSPTFNATTSAIVAAVLDDVKALVGRAWTPPQMAGVAAHLSSNHRLLVQKKQWLVDVSELVKRDARSGIQRVVRALLLQLLRNPPAGCVVEPVYACDDGTGFRYARAFKAKFLGASLTNERDEPVETWPGDVFLGLDLNPTLNVQQQAKLQQWRQRSVRVVFVLYDLLPVLMPEAFDGAVSTAHQHWLGVISQYDGVMAISRTVADEFVEWLHMYGPTRARPLRVGWFHLGSELVESAPTSGLPSTARGVLRALKQHTTFLMVGTVEPRKGHADVLGAFESLWRQGHEVNLVIVGKAGWLVDDLAFKMRMHPQSGQRLHWLEGISDEYLELVYANATALIAASVGEGFGLPLVEGARHGLALIARDIPVFREVADDAAWYFPAVCTPAQLADRLAEWLQAHAADRHPRSDDLRALTWGQSAIQLVKRISADDWLHRWVHDGILRFGAADSRIHITSAGTRKGRGVHSIGVEGNVVHGPYVTLPPGRYRVRLWGKAGSTAGGGWFDIVHDAGRSELLREKLTIDAPGTWESEVPLSLDREVESLEVRLWVRETTDISFEGLEIAPLAEDDAADSCDPTRTAVGASPLAAGLGLLT